MIYQKVYASRRPLDVSTLCYDGIIRSSERSNTALGITGILVAEGGRFFQVLEGERAAVEWLYARIARDPRHVDVRLLIEREIPDRMFPDWAMAFRDVDTIKCEDHCFELTRRAVIDGAFEWSDDLLRDLVCDFLESYRATNRGSCELFA